MTFQKIAGAVVAVLAFVVGMNMLVNAYFPGTKPVDESAYASTSPSGGAPAPAAAAAPLRPLDERLATAKADNGKAITAKCASCHSFVEGGGTKVGPNLFGVFGRAKASMAGFSYSAGLQGLGGNWTAADLDKFLTKPSAFAAGTKMTFAGLADGDQRADVIAYLKSLGGK
jgi:cytochrome c